MRLASSTYLLFALCLLQGRTHFLHSFIGILGSSQPASSVKSHTRRFVLRSFLTSGRVSFSFSHRSRNDETVWWLCWYFMACFWGLMLPLGTLVATTGWVDGVRCVTFRVRAIVADGCSCSVFQGKSTTEPRLVHAAASLHVVTTATVPPSDALTTAGLARAGRVPVAASHILSSPIVAAFNGAMRPSLEAAIAPPRRTHGCRSKALGQHSGHHTS
jgi:hypothetical protein